MSVLVKANIKVGNNLMKSANMTVERVTRSAVATPVVKLSGATVSDVVKGQQHLYQLSSFSGLVAGDKVKIILQTSGDDSDGSAFVELSTITFVNGSECAWTYTIPASWSGILIVSVQHVNYENKTIGYRYYALK